MTICCIDNPVHQENVDYQCSFANAVWLRMCRTSDAEPEDKWTWPDPGPREDIKMSDKNMTISGSIKFNKSPKKLPKLSCLRVKFEDHSIADGSAYVFAEKKIDMSEVDVSDKPLTYSLVSKMPHKTELWRDVSMVAVLNVGWCRTGPTPKWIRNRDYLTDTSIPISLEETKHDYSVDIPMVYYCVGPDCQDKVVKPAKLQEPSENFSAEDDTPETQVKPEKPSNKSEVLPTSPPIPPPNCTDLKGNDHDIDDEWEQDDCTTCRCTPLGIICNTVSCRAPCLNPVKVPGKCCPVCPPEPKRCVDDETGKKYKVGESWFGSDDCKKCTCLSGGMPVCSTPMCALPYCPLSRPVKIKGRCCPVCPKDKFCTDETDGRAYKMGLERWQRDTCEVCRCTKDGVVCVDPSRANKTCDYPQSYNMNCNPICIDDLVPPPGPMPVRPIGCLDNTNMGRPLGSIWHPDKCTTCTCTGKEYGQVSCTVVDCPPLKDCEEVTNLPRRCCPICKKYTNKTCEYKEKKYYNEDVVSLDDRCSVCTCKSGQWVCDRSYCEKKDKVCKYKGKIYKAGDLVMQDCNTCICGKRGGFACTEISCPPDLPKPLPKVSDPPPTAEEP